MTLKHELYQRIQETQIVEICQLVVLMEETQPRPGQGKISATSSKRIFVTEPKHKFTRMRRASTVEEMGKVAGARGNAPLPVAIS